MSIEYLVEGNRHRHWIDAHPTADLIDLHKEGRTMEGCFGDAGTQGTTDDY